MTTAAKDQAVREHQFRLNRLRELVRSAPRAYTSWDYKKTMEYKAAAKVASAIAKKLHPTDREVRDALRMIETYYATETRP